jgi:hypothetical protein
MAATQSASADCLSTLKSASTSLTSMLRFDLIHLVSLLQVHRSGRASAHPTLVTGRQVAQNGAHGTGFEYIGASTKLRSGMSAQWSLLGAKRTFSGLHRKPEFDPFLPLIDEFCCDARFRCPSCAAPYCSERCS